MWSRLSIVTLDIHSFRCHLETMSHQSLENSLLWWFSKLIFKQPTVANRSSFQSSSLSLSSIIAGFLRNFFSPSTSMLQSMLRPIVECKSDKMRNFHWLNDHLIWRIRRWFSQIENYFNFLFVFTFRALRWLISIASCTKWKSKLIRKRMMNFQFDLCVSFTEINFTFALMSLVFSCRRR